MTTQAAVAAQPAANGSAAASSAAAVKREPSPAPPEAAKAAAAAAAGTSSADGARRSGSPTGAAAGGDASARATPDAAAGAADAAPSKEDEEQRKLEDAILAEGQAIAGVRALLAKAFRCGKAGWVWSAHARKACMGPVCSYHRWQHATLLHAAVHGSLLESRLVVCMYCTIAASGALIDSWAPMAHHRSCAHRHEKVTSASTTASDGMG